MCIWKVYLFGNILSLKILYLLKNNYYNNFRNEYLFLILKNIYL